MAAARRSARGVAGDRSTRTRTRSLTVPWRRRSDTLELGVDSTGHEAQRKLAERSQIRLREEPVERDPGSIRRVDVAVAHPLAERVRAHVDEFDLVGRGEDLVRDPLVHRGARDRRYRVGDRVQVLDVAGADHVDPGVEQDVDVLPALGIRRTRGVGMCQLVDQGDRGMSRQDGIGIHLIDHDPAILDSPTWHDLEALEQLLGLGSAVGLDEADDEIGPASRATMPLLEHPVGLPDAGGHAEIDTQPATLALAIGRPDPGQHLVCRWTAVGVGSWVAHRSPLMVR